MPGEFRIIPTDNRKRNADADFDITYLGNSVGRWEGDTLVIDSIGFIDTTWLARGGFFHSDRMHVVEKFTRQGNTILYDVTVEDPDVLVEPWVNPTRTLQRNANPNRRQRRRHLEARPRKNIRGTECSPPRDEITVTIVPALDGKSPVGLLVAITYPDGHTLRFRSPDG